MSLLPIVSLTGPPELHERARRYNRRLFDLHIAQDDLEDATAWNRRERFGHGAFLLGLFTVTKPPVPTSALRERIRELEDGLAIERAAIVQSGESVKP